MRLKSEPHLQLLVPTIRRHCLATIITIKPNNLKPRFRNSEFRPTPSTRTGTQWPGGLRLPGQALRPRAFRPVSNLRKLSRLPGRLSVSLVHSEISFLTFERWLGRTRPGFFFMFHRSHHWPKTSMTANEIDSKFILPHSYFQDKWTRSCMYVLWRRFNSLGVRVV